MEEETKDELQGLLCNNLKLSQEIINFFIFKLLYRF